MSVRSQPIAPPPDDSASDAELAVRVTEGDAAAEVELCRRVLPRVRAWGLKHLRDETAALDLAQHVSMTLIEALRARRVDNVDRVGAFLIGVCKRTVLAWRSGESRRSTLLERFGHIFDGVAEMDESIPDRDRLAGCFDRLGPRARTVVALTYFAERSTQEIADELGTSAGNVRILRFRALEQLHACLEGT